MLDAAFLKPHEKQQIGITPEAEKPLLSILNNSNYPVLKRHEHECVCHAVAYLNEHVKHMAFVMDDLKGLGVDLSHMQLAVNYLHAYEFILNECLNTPENQKLTAYASQKVRAVK